MNVQLDLMKNHEVRLFLVYAFFCHPLGYFLLKD